MRIGNEGGSVRRLHSGTEDGFLWYIVGADGETPFDGVGHTSEESALADLAAIESGQDAPMEDAPTVEAFKRELRNTESQYRRMDSGTLTGRNADASADRLAWKLDRLRELSRADDVCSALDADERLAARWNRIERRAAGLR